MTSGSVGESMGLQHDCYIRPSTFEVAASWLHGRIPAPVSPNHGESLTPRQVLESVIEPAVLRPPCFVAFSGGRDSSAVLAVATDLARRNGVSDPVPMTEIYPNVPESDESEWQELVIEHLGLRDWLRIELSDGNDFLSPEATSSLSRRGLIWPAALHLKPSILSRLGAGSLLTGEGGDEVLGRRRGAQVSRLWRRGKRRDTIAIRSAVGAVAPETWRRRRASRHLDVSGMQPWISDIVRIRHHQLMAADLASEPLSTAKSLEWLLTRRSSAAASRNYRKLAAEFDVELCEPLLDPGFVRSFSKQAAHWGYRSRTDAMRAVFADVLPDAILARRSKAYFNRAFLGERTRSFALQWTGEGVDPSMVDSDILRAEWLSEVPSGISTLLLQTAWLHSNRSIPLDRAGSA